MKRVLLVSAQEDFEFPLAEAARKQLFATACRYRDRGDTAQILVVTRDRHTQFECDGIGIRIIEQNRLISLRHWCRGFDIIQYFGTTGVIAAAIGWLTRSRPRTLTITDGGVFSTGKNRCRRKRLARLIPRLYDKVEVYTKYQKELLYGVSKKYEDRISIIRPMLEDPPSSLPPVDLVPTIIYLGHLSRFKGVDIVLTVFERLADEIPNLRLTLASNGLTYDDDISDDVNRLVDRFPDRVALVGKVEVFEALSQAHLLMHPMRCHSGTFAVPLSLYESICCGTPFLSSRLEGLREYFDDTFLCDPGDTEQFVDRARYILSHPDESRIHIEKNLNRIRQAGHQYEHSH